MIGLFFIFTVITVAVTFTVYSYIVGGLISMGENMLARFAARVMFSVPMAVLVNIGVSMFLLAFTGSGALAGMANLASSIIAGIFGPRYMKHRYYGSKSPFGVLSGLRERVSRSRLFRHTF